MGRELHDYELLEILLFSAQARVDTKPLAKKLIARFGDVAGVINAEVDALRDVEGVGDSVIVAIKIISEISNRTLKKSASGKEVLNNWQAVLNYAQAVLGHIDYEAFRVLFLNRKNQLIADELLAVGDNDHVLVSSKLIVKKALLLQASKIILLHNHPSGDLRASAVDIKTTNEIVAVLKNLNIAVLDHLVIAGSSYFSFKENGLL